MKSAIELPPGTRIGQTVAEALADIVTAPRRPDERADEKAFQADVVKLARRHGWEVFHMTNALKSQPGWPDLVLWRDRVLFRELKTERGVLSGSQEETLAGLKAAGADACVWRPADWPQIVATLTI